MPTIESYLQNAPLPQAAKADAWEAYQTPDHDSFVSSVGKLNLPQKVKADMYEMRYGVKDQPLASIPKPADPILNGPEAKMTPTNEMLGNNGLLGGWDKPVFDLNKVPLYNRAFDPNSTSTASQVAQHTAKFIADQTTPKNAAIMAGAEIGAPALAAGVEATGPALGYSPAAVASGAAKAASGAHRVMAGYFGTMGAAGTYNNFRQTVQDAVAGKPITGDVTDTVLDGAVSAFGLRGMIHGEAPPANTQSPVSPIVDHPMDHSQSVAPMQGRLFPESEHTAPTASNGAQPAPDTQQLSLDFHPGQRDLFAQHGADYSPPTVNPSPVKTLTTPEQMQLMPWQGNLFPKEVENSTPDSIPDVQSVLNPMQGRLFSVKGEALPPQEAIAGPMSPEAEATSKAAQDKAQGEPTSPSGTTRLYHGSAQPGRYDGSAWFSSNKEYAKNYRSAAELQYVDYPTAKLNALADPDETGQTPAKGFTFNGELHSDETGLRKPVTEGPTGSGQLSKLEDSIRTQTGQVMRLDQLEKGNQIHAALERGIEETQSALDPRARNVGPGITPEDQKILSIALGEKVTSVLTPDQVDKAYALRGKVMSETPELQLRPRASEDRIARSRVEMAKDIATTQDPELKAKLQTALQPGEDGKPQPFLYEPARKNASAISLDADHPEAPFAPKAFGAQYPDISLDNWETALGYRPRAADHGLGDPELKAQLKGMKAPSATAEGTGTVKANTEGFSYDTPNNPKGINGDAKLLKNQILEGAVRTRRGQIASQLQSDVKAYQNLRDSSNPSQLIDQLKGLEPSTLPKEVQELVKPPKSETSEKNAGTPSSLGAKTPEARNSTPASKGSTLGKAKAGIASLYDHFQKRSPEHLGDVQDLIQTAADHFGNDTQGAVVASFHALKTLKQGIEQDDPYAMRDAIKMIRRLKPAEESQGGVALPRGSLGQTPTLYSGIDPTLAKGIARDVAKGVGDLKDYVAPKLTPEDLAASSNYAANALLGRYEKMTPIDRGAYRAQIHSDELDRMVADGDPDGSKGYHDRLAALRKISKPDDLYSRFKEFVQDNEKGILADDTSRMIRSANGSRYVNDLRLETAVNKFSTMVDKWSNQESRDFYHKMEAGADQGDTMKNQIASVLRKSLDEARDRITAVNGNFQEYIENYMPHIWANVGKGAELGKQLRGMSGNESFLKNRELETFNEGIKQGLQPVTYNPLKLTMMRVEQMNRYAMKEQLKQDFIGSNKATLIEGNQPVPDGWVPLEDRAFEKGGSGKYYAPAEVAKVFNNFTSEGLSGKGVIPILNRSAYDGLRSLNNGLNQMQLGLSGLHAAFTVTNSVISELSRGLAKGVNGDVTGGLKTALSSLNVPERWTLGKNLIAHIKDPNSFQEMNSLADAFQRAGGRVGTDKIMGTAYADQFLKARRDAMDDAIKGGKKAAAWGRVASNAIGATMEKFSAPIMEKIVPRMKIGAFAKMANEILSENDGKPAAEIDLKLQQAWNNVDDRFGQMVYDNVFWPKVAKDIAMLTTRAPGWNIGTYRGLGGGILDLGKSVRDAATKKERFQITDRTAYLGAVVASTMAVNAMLQMAMTGKGPGQAVDYFYPKTGTQDDNGEENRLMPKMYTYDYINAAKDPVGTVLHKVSPLIGTLTQLHANKSFYGRQIYDPGSSVGGRMAQMVGYTMKQYTPLSISNYQEQNTRGNGGVDSYLRSFVGILPAPKSAGRSDAENLAGEYHAESMAQGGEEGDVFDKHQKFVQLQADLRNGKVTPDQLGKMVNSGQVPTSFLDHIYDKQNTPNLERWTKGLSPTRAMKVFDRATPEEKQRLTPILLQKMDKLDPSEIQSYADKINAAQYHPDTHVFSQSKWAAANPGQDHSAAASQAQIQGYEVHP